MYSTVFRRISCPICSYAIVHNAPYAALEPILHTFNVSQWEKKILANSKANELTVNYWTELNRVTGKLWLYNIAILNNNLLLRNTVSSKANTKTLITTGVRDTMLSRSIRLIGLWTGIINGWEFPRSLRRTTISVLTGNITHSCLWFYLHEYYVTKYPSVKVT